MLKINSKYRLKVAMMLLAFSIQVSVNQIFAQDLHYSQFYNSPMNLNPALTGVFNGDQRFNLSVRDQWRFVPVPWFTFSGAYDAKIILPEKKYFFGYGVNFNYDRQGDSRLVLAGLNLSGSFNYQINQNNIVNIGLLIGGARRGFNTKDLTWDKQWNGDNFDPSLGSGEVFDMQAFNFVETGAGLNYRLQKTSRTKVDLGIGIFHLIEPKTTFYNIPSRNLPRHFSYNAMGSVQVLQSLDVLANIMHQRQTVYNETVMNGLLRLYINQRRGKELTLDLGLGYRTAGSLFPILAIGYNNWYVSGSYDIDRTQFNQTLANNRGGPEIHLRYIFKSVPAMNTRKVCPIY